nr:MAG TPA: hypothetical protein [Caudoviricetes sp.]
MFDIYYDIQNLPLQKYNLLLVYPSLLERILVYLLFSCKNKAAYLHRRAALKCKQKN